MYGLRYYPIRIEDQQLNFKMVKIFFHEKKYKNIYYLCFALMNKSRFRLIKTILITSIFTAFSSEIYAVLPKTIIQSCYDGDTCTAIDGEKIRLACIDTPELKGRRADPIPAKKSRDFLNYLLANEEVYIKRITNDRYGRTVAELFKNDINVQKLMIDKDYAKIYERYSYQCDWTKRRKLMANER